MGRSFYRSIIANGSLMGGIFIGIKFADYLMWNPQKYDAMKEEIELDYWKKYGRPQVIEPELWKSSINEGEFYQTWLRAKNRKEYMEEKVYKLA
jgi:hypothetical protein